MRDSRCEIASAFCGGVFWRAAEGEGVDEDARAVERVGGHGGIDPEKEQLRGEKRGGGEEWQGVWPSEQAGPQPRACA